MFPHTTRFVRSSRLAAALLVCVALGAHAPAQAYPTKPIRLIVNFPPGGSVDVLARAVAAPLSAALGQPVTVENRAGAGGLIGVEAAIRSPADGYTLLLSAGAPIAIAPHLTKLTFDPIKDLVPVAAGARLELFLVARSEMPFTDFAGFLAHMRAHPGKLNYGSAGNGTIQHIAGEMLVSVTKTSATHVPYKGGALMVAGLLGGDVDWAFDSGVASFPHVRTGKLRLLAVTGPKRLAQFPATPTLAEVGLADFDIGTTHGFWAPAGTPARVIERLNREINRALALPAVIETVRVHGLAEPTPLSPAELLAVTQADSVRYARIIRERKITAD